MGCPRVSVESDYDEIFPSLRSAETPPASWIPGFQPHRWLGLDSGRVAIDFCRALIAYNMLVIMMMGLSDEYKKLIEGLHGGAVINLTARRSWV